MNTYGYSSSNGLVRHASISPYTFLSLSLNVRDGILPPHGNWPVSSTCRVLTPARYMSMRASSTLSSRLRYRSMTADSKTAPLSLGTFNASLPALAVRLRSWWPALYAFRSPVRSYLAALAISSASASSIAFNSSATFSATKRSSLVSSRFWSICMMFEGLGSVSWLPIAVFCFGE